jgi:signal transduction histidine kinase
MNPPSIHKRLLIRCGLGVGLLLVLLSTGVYGLVRQRLLGQLDDSVKQTAALLANQVELERETINYEWQEGLGTNQALISDDLFQFWDVTIGATTRSPSLDSRDLPQFTGANGLPLLRTIELPTGHRGRAIGMKIYPFVLPEEVKSMKQRGTVIDPQDRPHILVVARDAEPVHQTLKLLRWVLGCGSVLTLGIGFVLIGRVVRTTLRPMDELTVQVKDRAEHQLDSALELPDTLPVELAGLAQNFDLLLARVAAIRQREKDFIRHAAHELRTPIAGLQATTDLALSQPRDAAAYAAHLATCQKTALELGELVKRLSALARVGQPSAPPALSRVDVTDLLRNCLESFLPQLEIRGLLLQQQLPQEPLHATADAALLRIIFNNLLDNAVSYTSDHATVRISASALAGRVEIRIANPTADLPENLERLFEPLFRRDPSRSDAGSHLGIGLTLSLEAATAMAASLRATQPHPGQVEFTLSLPASSGT